MNRQIQNRTDNHLLLCLASSFITALLAFLYFIVKGHGALTMVDDFNTQQLIFPFAIQTALKEQGAGQWFWGLDLGCSFVNGFSFYNLGSLFYWLSFPFPKTWYPYLVGPLTILKYVVAACLAYLYLKRFVKNRTYAVAAALLYAFSGYQTTNLEFHFHDAVAFFPLLLIGVEGLAAATDRPRRKSLFVFAVFLNCITNYFFFIQEAVFLVLYYLFRFWGKPIKEFVRDAFTCLFCALLGMGMAAVLFLPSMLYILGNPRSESALYLSRLVYDSQNFLFILKGLLLPGEPMNRNSAVIAQEWNSTASYLPVVGLSLVFAYLAGQSKNWLKRFLLLLLTVSFSPLLQAAFLGFTATYQRWWFMLTLMMALASALVLDAPDKYEIPKYAAWNLLVVVAFGVCVKWVPWTGETRTLVFNDRQFLLGIGLAVLGPLLLLALFGCRWSIPAPRVLLLAIMGVSIVTTAITVREYRRDTHPDEFLEQCALGTQLKVMDEQYRYDRSENEVIMTGNAAGVGCFSSTISNSSRRFDTLFDHYSTNETWFKRAFGQLQLLAGKYGITTSSDASNVIDTLEVNGTTYYITERAACPIGYTVEHYITRESLLALELDKRAIALMNAAVVSAEDAAVLADAVTELDPEILDYTDVDPHVARCVDHAVKEFSRDSSGFTCAVDLAQAGVAFFTVPYDSGWSATIDGSSAAIVDSCGMMSLKIPAGNHTVHFIYHTPGLQTGIRVSALAWILFVLVLLWETKRRRRKKGY